MPDQPALRLIPTTRDEAVCSIADCLEDLLDAYGKTMEWVLAETLRRDDVPESAYEGCYGRIMWAGERLDDYRRLSGEPDHA